MRADRLFEILQEHGYELQRITGSHFMLSKPGRGVLPVAVHDHQVREDAADAILRLIRMSDEEYRERCQFFKRAVKEGNIPGNGGRGDGNTAEIRGGKAKRRAAKLNAKKRATRTNITAKSRPGPSAPSGECAIAAATAYEEKKQQEAASRAARVESLQNRIDDILHSGPERIACGCHNEVSQELCKLFLDMEHFDNYTVTDARSSTKKFSTPRNRLLAADQEAAARANAVSVTVESGAVATSLPSSGFASSAEVVHQQEIEASQSPLDVGTPTNSSSGTTTASSPALEEDDDESSTSNVTNLIKLVTHVFPRVDAGARVTSSTNHAPRGVLDLCFLAVVTWLQELKEQAHIPQQKIGEVFSAITAANAPGGLIITNSSKEWAFKQFVTELQDKVDEAAKVVVHLHEFASLFRFFDQLQAHFWREREEVGNMRNYFREAVCNIFGGIIEGRWEAIRQVRTCAGYDDELTGSENVQAMQDALDDVFAQVSSDSPPTVEEGCNRLSSIRSDFDFLFLAIGRRQETAVLRDEMKFCEVLLEHVYPEEGKSLNGLRIRSALSRTIFSVLGCDFDRAKAVRNLKKMLPPSVWDFSETRLKQINRPGAVVRTGETAVTRHRNYFQKLLKVVAEYSELERSAREKHPTADPQFWKEMYSMTRRWTDPIHLPFLARKLLALSVAIWDLLEVYRTYGMPPEWGFRSASWSEHMQYQAAIECGQDDLLDGGEGLYSFLAHDFQNLMVIVPELFEIATARQRPFLKGDGAVGTNKRKLHPSKRTTEAPHKEALECCDVVLAAISAAHAVRLHPLVRRSPGFRDMLTTGMTARARADWILEFIKASIAKNSCFAFDKLNRVPFSSLQRNWILLWKFGMGRVADFDLREDARPTTKTAVTKYLKRYSHPYGLAVLRACTRAIVSSAAQVFRVQGIGSFLTPGCGFIEEHEQQAYDNDYERSREDGSAPSDPTSNSGLATNTIQELKEGEQEGSASVNKPEDNQSTRTYLELAGACNRFQKLLDDHREASFVQPDEGQPLCFSAWSADPSLMAVCANARGELHVQKMGKDGEKLSRRKLDDHRKYLKTIRDTFHGNTKLATALRDGQEITNDFLLKWKDSSLVRQQEPDEQSAQEIAGAGTDTVPVPRSILGDEDHCSTSAQPATLDTMVSSAQGRGAPAPADHEKQAQYVSNMEWHYESIWLKNCTVAGALHEDNPAEAECLDIALLLTDLHKLVQALEVADSVFQSLRRTLENSKAWKYFEEFHVRKAK
ncbi:unnamed protein product [Amoebophrya sp. A120]|nr:unnamed protein product [Amoebophrya sp. A120]|eukprot:GSA120T00000670001.1